MKKDKSKGFTLVEVLISLSILSILMLVFFSIINTSIKTNKKNEIDINAMNIAQSEVENIRVQIKNNNTSNIKNLENNIIIKNEKNTYTLDDYNLEILVQQKSELLYEINVKVKPKNSNFSKKEAQIITQVVIGRNNSM